MNTQGISGTRTWLAPLLGFPPFAGKHELRDELVAFPGRVSMNQRGFAEALRADDTILTEEPDKTKKNLK